MDSPVRDVKNFMMQAEIAQAHSLYIQNMMPMMIAKVLTDQRHADFPSLPAIEAKTIQNHASNRQWAVERKAYMERQSETIATALEAIKEQAGTEMVVIVKSLHNSFLLELDMIDDIRKSCKTARDMLDIAKALETVQKRLFHFHALRSTPLASAAVPAQSVDAGSSAMSGGEAA